MGLDKLLVPIYKQSSSITFISGRRGYGKTDFAFRIGEDGLEDHFFDKIAANVELSRLDPRCILISYYNTLEEWLLTEGKKLYILDELGKEAYRMDFLSAKSKVIMKLCQLVRKYDAHLIGIAPSDTLVNKLFMNTDILDAHMVKMSKKIVQLKNYVTFKMSYLTEIPRTTIPFKTKYIAQFELKDPAKRRQLETLPYKERVALLYLKHRSLRKVGRLMDLSHEEIRKILEKYVASKDVALSTVNSAVDGI